MKKFFKNLGVLLLMFTMVFAVVYMLMIAADTVYEVMLEQEKAYLDRVEEMKND